MMNEGIGGWAALALTLVGLLLVVPAVGVLIAGGLKLMVREEFLEDNN